MKRRALFCLLTTLLAAGPLVAEQATGVPAAVAASFRDDPQWVKVKADSESAGALTTKIESVFLARADYSPLK